MAEIGAVFYEDDWIVFRIVYPVDGDPPNILDDPRWLEIGCDPARRARLVKLDADNPDWSQFKNVANSIDPRRFRAI